MAGAIWHIAMPDIIRCRFAAGFQLCRQCRRLGGAIRGVPFKDKKLYNPRTGYRFTLGMSVDFGIGDELKKPLYYVAGALLLTMTMTMAAMAGSQEGTPAADGNRAGDVGERASAARAGNPGNPGNRGRKAKSKPAGGIKGGSPAAPAPPAVAAWIALFKSFETNLTEYESAPPESPLPDAKPFTLY